MRVAAERDRRQDGHPPAHEIGLPVDRGAARELRRILETPKIGNVDILARGKVENDEFVELRIDIAKAEARAEIAAEHRLRLNLRAPDAGADRKSTRLNSSH